MTTLIQPVKLEKSYKVLFFLLQFSIEPISGIAMQLKLRFQLNGKIIPNSSLSPYYPETKNVSYTDKLIPILWTETEASIDAVTAKEFRSKVSILH